MTRPSHRQVDGEIRELDEEFSNGLQFPGDPHGAAEEVCGCRCALLQRGRWALGNKFTKMDGESNELVEFIDEDDYKSFKKEYFKRLDNKTQNTYNGIIKKEKVVFDTNSEKPFEIKISREHKKAIIDRGINEKLPIFAVDTNGNKFASAVRNVLSDDGFYDVALHVKDTYVDFFGEPIDAYILSQIIRQRNDYKKGTPVRLLSCNVGNTSNTGDCVAQLVANELGVRVKAPTDTLYVYPNGEFFIGRNKSGKMKVFYPRK